MKIKIIKTKTCKHSEKLTEPTGIQTQDPSFSFLTAALQPDCATHSQRLTVESRAASHPYDRKCGFLGE